MMTWPNNKFRISIIMDNLKTILSEIGKSSLEDVGDVYSIVGDLTGMVGLDIADNDIFSFIGNSGETTGTVRW